MKQPNTLLPPNSLVGTRLALSVSPSDDLDELGLLETHFRLTLGEIARCVLIGGGKIAYGGHLEPDGYTSFLMRELERYGRRDEPLLVVLPWPVHCAMSESEVKQQVELLGLNGEIQLLDINGNKMDSGQKSLHQATDSDWHDGLTSMRKTVTAETEGRILLGGKRSNFKGRMPGILEEFLLTLKTGKPIYLAGGFGGMALDILNCIDKRYGAWFPGLHDVPTQLRPVFSHITRIGTETGWKSFENGLYDDEKLLLATTHRPSEVAALVSLGLGRIFSDNNVRNQKT